MSKDSSAKYYKNSKEGLQKKSLEKYRKNKKRQHGRKRYENLSDDGKQNLVESRKNYYVMRENKNASQIKTD